MTTSELLAHEFDELRSRRETEEKLVRLWVVVCSGILIGAFAFAQWVDSRLLLLFVVLAAALIVGLGIRIANKIDAEHEVYAGVGRTIVTILQLEYSLGDPSSSKKNIGSDIAQIGQGRGHARTSEIVRFSAGFTALALLILGFALLLCPPRKEPSKVLQQTPTTGASAAE